MSDIMRQISFEKLLDWILEEYENYGTIFGISKENFYQEDKNSWIEFFGERLGTPLGPAAGPHTQLAQNIVSAYLCGSRFFELKTVQILDELEIAKPCILAEDECYNTEWSTELTVEGALAEYVKAWFLLHLLQKELFNLDERSFIFNMSVGYDLKGIQSLKIDNFIEGLKDASKAEVFKECRKVIAGKIQQKKFKNITTKYLDSISANICNSITLSTLHGCPPEEIESICQYLIKEKKLHTFVKMNPTLLGYDYVRKTFDKMGYDYIELKEEAFTHDLQYSEGVALLKRLQIFAQENKRQFGVKLSNTLPTQITRGELPGEEMYMSGKSLYPLTINLALKLAREFAGDLQISYSGGADFFNLAGIYETGIEPITMATTLLKPGGYLRFKQLAELLEPNLDKDFSQIDLEKLKELADNVSTDKNYLKQKQPGSSRKIGEKLPLLNCYIAPCMVGCPIGQDIPEYIRLVGEGKYVEAYEVIVAKNPLPFITGTICNHNCMTKCTRLDYDEPVLIREQKKMAAENGFQIYLENLVRPELKSGAKVAIIGAGPAGLSAGYFLAKAGLDVTIFDKREKPGGTVEYFIPDFRLPGEALEKDVQLIREMGVKFQLGVDGDFSIEKLKSEGYKYIILAIGAEKRSNLELNNTGENIINALDFLEQFNSKGDKLELGRSVVVVGGGNTALDAARAALRVKGVDEVTVVYRRTKEYMPADREELELAVAEGVTLKQLLVPLEVKNGLLKCQKMELGEADASGRKRPHPVAGEYEEISAQTIITAIGELVDYDFLVAKGLELDEDGGLKVEPTTNETNLPNVFIGGDALTGPATVVEAIASASKVAEVIASREGLTIFEQRELKRQKEKEDVQRIILKKGRLKKSSLSVKRCENERCLECNILCNICTEVCPNRANVEVSGQIIHIDGMCNECGNCAVFCPYQGSPYKDKLTLYWHKEDFFNSENDGFRLIQTAEEPVFQVRLEGITAEIKFNSQGEAEVIGDKELAKKLAGNKEIIRLIWSAFKEHNYLF